MRGASYQQRAATRGTIRRRGNSLQVIVYAGLDPVTGKRMYLRGSTTDEAEAERILTRFRAQVDEQRHARTNATLRFAIEEWLKVAELEETTRAGYERYARRHIGPALGAEPVGKISARVLEQLSTDPARTRGLPPRDPDWSMCRSGNPTTSRGAIP